jgi:hypothetical protein
MMDTSSVRDIVPKYVARRRTVSSVTGERRKFMTVDTLTLLYDEIELLSTGLMLVGTLFNVPKKRPSRPENPRLLWLHFRTKAVHASLTRNRLPNTSNPSPPCQQPFHLLPVFMIRLRLPLIHPMGVLSAGLSALSALWFFIVSVT